MEALFPLLLILLARYIDNRSHHFAGSAAVTSVSTYDSSHVLLIAWSTNILSCAERRQATDQRKSVIMVGAFLAATGAHTRRPVGLV